MPGNFAGDSGEEIQDNQFVDAEEYHPQQKGAMTYEQIVLEQIRRCVVEGSKEMVGGYWKERESKGRTVEIYVPDQKQVYIQCVKQLYDLLMPYFETDKSILQDIKEFEAILKEIKESKIRLLKLELLKAVDLRVRNSLNTQINTGYLDNDSYYAKMAMEEKLDVYREMYQSLLLMFQRQRFLMSSAIED